jgi:hypothetical protein
MEIFFHTFLRAAAMHGIPAFLFNAFTLDLDPKAVAKFRYVDRATILFHVVLLNFEI